MKIIKILGVLALFSSTLYADTTIQVHNATNTNMTVHQTTLKPDEEKAQISVPDDTFTIEFNNKKCQNTFTVYANERYSLKYDTTYQDLSVVTDHGIQWCKYPSPNDNHISIENLSNIPIKISSYNLSQTSLNPGNNELVIREKYLKIGNDNYFYCLLSRIITDGAQYTVLTKPEDPRYVLVKDKKTGKTICESIQPVKFTVKNIGTIPITYSYETHPYSNDYIYKKIAPNSTLTHSFQKAGSAFYGFYLGDDSNYYSIENINNNDSYTVSTVDNDEENKITVTKNGVQVYTNSIPKKSLVTISVRNSGTNPILANYVALQPGESSSKTIGGTMDYLNLTTQDNKLSCGDIDRQNLTSGAEYTASDTTTKDGDRTFEVKKGDTSICKKEEKAPIPTTIPTENISENIINCMGIAIKGKTTEKIPVTTPTYCITNDKVLQCDLEKNSLTTNAKYTISDTTKDGFRILEIKKDGAPLCIKTVEVATKQPAPAPVCPDNSKLEGDKCIADATCSEGATLDKQKGTCTKITKSNPTCPKETKLENGKCVTEPTCPTEFTFDQNTKKCTKAINIPPTCEQNTTLDKTTGTCVGTLTKDSECPKDFKLENGNCTGTPTCPPKSELKNNKCTNEQNEKVDATCPEKTKLTDGKCVSEPTCPQDFTFDQNTKKCTKPTSAEPTCKSNTTFDKTTGKCTGTVTKDPGCSKDFKLENGECVAKPTTCPEKSELKDNQCILTEVENAQCPTNFKFKNGRCVGNTLPPPPVPPSK